MTSNQIALRQALETERSNRAREAETTRSNMAKELEERRSNLSSEAIQAEKNATSVRNLWGALGLVGNRSSYTPTLDERAYVESGNSISGARSLPSYQAAEKYSHEVLTPNSYKLYA